MATSFNTSAIRRLEGKVALITGAASGIGESTVRLFVQHGAKVMIADIQDDLGHSLCKELGSQDTVSYVHCDVSRDADLEKAVDLAVSKFGKLDIMFGNAAIIGKLGSRIRDSDNEEAKRVIDVDDLFGSFLSAKHAARVMIPAKKGCILFTSSIVSAIITASPPHEYVAAKHGVVGLTKSLCVELGAHGIRVNCISPYMVATPLLTNSSGLTKTEGEKLASAASNLKVAVLEPEDIAHAALYLASDEAKYISGVNLAVDGGYSATSSALTNAIKSLLSQN